MGFPLTEAQRAAVENTGGPLLVSAAAGAGKTRVLVERLLDRVRQGADVDEFLVITFTNAAAAELRGRVAQALADLLAENPGDRHLRRQTTLVYDAHISTVHAFCQETLRSWGHLLDIDPDFRLCDEGERALLQAEALTGLLEKRYETAEGDEGFAQMLDTFSAGRDDRALTAMVLELYNKLQSHPDPQGWLAAQGAAFRADGVEDVAQTPWGDYLLGSLRRRGAYWYKKLSPIYRACEIGVSAYCPSLAVTLDDLGRLAEATSWDGAPQVRFPRLGSSAKCKDPDLAQRAKALRQRCKDELDRACEPLGRKSDALLRDLRDVAPAVEALLELTAQFARAYDALKARRNVLDFNDLEHRTLELLGAHPSAAQAIRSRFREVMVDEYQDTNQVQNAIFSALTEEAGDLFLVGDVKQSIYRFRLADPTLFLERYRAWPPAEQAAPGEGRRVTLGENFRSRRSVIDGVNFLFQNLMSTTLGELDYGPEEALKCRSTFPENGDDRLELFVLENPKADEEGLEEMAEPRFLAHRLARLLEEGWPVSDGAGGTRPVEPGDMVILLRSPGRVIGRYARALAERGIPWESEGGDDFFDEPETAVALSYLEIIDNPRQDVPLIAVLRSPLYGMDPNRLATLRTEVGDGCFYDALVRDGGEDARRFLEELDELRSLAVDHAAREVIWELYRRTGLLEVYTAMEGGEVRREHLMALYGYAQRFESAGARGLFGFLTHLRRRREQGETMSAPAGTAGSGVKILSIHRSKGLEFPVVAVGGLAKGFNRQDSYAPMLFHQSLGLGPKGLDRARRIQYPTAARWAVAAKLEEENLSEELRLLYVALTRAKEKLILSITMKDPRKEIEKLLEDAGLPPDPQALLSQKSMGHWVLSAALCRPEAEGLRGLEGAGAMWDGDFGAPWRMELVDAAPYRVRPQGPGQVTDGVRTVRGGIPDYRWRYPFEALADIPSKLTATQLKGRSLDAEVAQDAKADPRPILFDRPDFALEARGLTPGERGTAHHLVMQYLDFARTGSREEIAEQIEDLARREIITPQQARAVDPAVIFAFFQSPLGREALGAQTLHREFKFSVLEDARRYYPELPEGETILLQGVVDCWYETPEGLVVVDFKSDHITETGLMDRAENYRPQLDAYSRALSRVVGRPVCRRALWFFALSREVDL